MIIALDYDGTFTALPAEIVAFVQLLKDQGHRVICCTMRTPEEAEDMHPALTCMVEVFATSRRAKMDFLKEQGIQPHIWIDDNPMWIYMDAGDRPLINQKGEDGLQPL